MPLPLNGKRVDLARLDAELTAAGVAHRALGTAGDALYTYSTDGTVADLPAGAAAVVEAHVAPSDPIEYTGLRESEWATTTANAPVGLSQVLIRLPLDLQTGYMAEVDVVGIDRANGVMKRLLFTSVFKRLNAGGLAVGARQDLAAREDTGAAATTSGVASWTVVPSIDGNDAIVTVAGAAGRTVDWFGFVAMRRFRPGGIL